MSKVKQAIIAQTLEGAAYWRKQPWTNPFQINPRWLARRMIRKARLIRLLVR
jgi:hypothetical protein